MKLLRMAMPFLALAVAMIPAAATAAPPYPPGEASITVSDGTVEVGDSVEVTGRGFQPGEPIIITVSYGPNATGADADQARRAEPNEVGLPEIGGRKVIADYAGGFRTQVTLKREGRAVITATGKKSGRSGSATVLVVDDKAGGPYANSSYELPDDVNSGTYLPLGLMGLGVAMVGGALLRLRLKRRTS